MSAKSLNIRKFAPVGGGIATLTIAVLLSGCSLSEDPSVSSTPSPATYETSYAHSSSVIDRENLAEVAGFASDIFFADIEENLGSTEKRGVLETQFSGTVTETLKGGASGKVKINQTGGLKDGVVSVEEGSALLTPGVTYLIAARYSATEEWYTAIPITGDVPVSGDNSRSRGAEGRDSQNQDSVRTAMQDAIANEIPFAGAAGDPSPQGATSVPSSTSLPTVTTTIAPPPSVIPSAEPSEGPRPGETSTAPSTTTKPVTTTTSVTPPTTPTQTP